MYIEDIFLGEKECDRIFKEEYNSIIELHFCLLDFQKGKYYFELKEKENSYITINDKQYFLLKVYANFLINELILQLKEEEKN